MRDDEYSAGEDERIVGESEGYEAAEGDGDVLGEADVLGALWRRRRRRGRKGIRTPGGARIYQKPPLPQVPFQPNVARLRSYMGLGFASWTSADKADKVLSVQPQESFRGERLIIDVSLVSGPSAGMVLLRRIDIGTLPQSPSVEQPAPAAMFAAQATYSAIELQIAYRATTIQVTLGITDAPGGSCVVTAAVGLFGEWVR